LQASTNVLSWDPLIQLHLSTSPYPYVDLDSGQMPMRFYRVKSP